MSPTLPLLHRLDLHGPAELPEAEARELVDAGYITRIGHQYRITDEGRRALFEGAMAACEGKQSVTDTLQGLGFEPDPLYVQIITEGLKYRRNTEERSQL